jgi:hypothetical protein
MVGSAGNRRVDFVAKDSSLTTPPGAINAPDLGREAPETLAQFAARWLRPSFLTVPHRRIARFLVAALLTGALALLIDFSPLTKGWFIQSGDLKSHYAWSVALIEGLRAGYLYPRWSANSNLGLGEPSFYYYAPLTYYACALVNAAVRDVWLSLRIAVFLSNWAAGLITFAFVFRDRLPRALAGALAVQASPIFFAVLAFNAAFAWAFALPFYCLVLLSYARRTPEAPVSPALAVAYATACLSHILSGFMLGVVLAGAEAAGLVRQPTLARLRSAMGVGAALVLGAALAGAYLVPALGALRHVNPKAMVAAPGINWRETFIFAAATAFHYGVRWKLYQYAIAALVLVPLAVTAARSWGGAGREPVEARLLAVGLVALFFASELSAPLWFAVAPLRFVQFAYRFLAPMSVAGLLACAWRLGRSRTREPMAWAAVALTMLGLLSLQAKLGSEGQAVQFQGSLEGKLFSDSNMIPAVYGPDWRGYGERGGLLGECERLDLRCEVLENKPQARRWRIVVPPGAPEPADIGLPAFAFPTWSVMVNGAPQERQVDPATGAIVARLAAGSNVVELRWAPLPEERAGWVVSSISAVLLIALAAMRSRILRATGRRGTVLRDGRESRSASRQE